MAGLAKAPSALADIITTLSLCYNLGYAKTGVRACVIYVLWLLPCSLSKIAYPSTDSVLKTLIGFVIQRGVLVALVQTTLLIVFYASSSRLYWYVNNPAGFTTWAMG
jgi:hypothetical protein